MHLFKLQFGHFLQQRLHALLQRLVDVCRSNLMSISLAHYGLKRGHNEPWVIQYLNAGGYSFGGTHSKQCADLKMLIPN